MGLLAPFEGKGRATGYEALYAVKLALQERNTSGGVAGWSVELLALDNEDQVPETAKQARVLAVDPDVVHALVVVEANDQPAAADELRPLALPFELLPALGAGNGAAASATFIESYRNISGGITPGDLAVRTYAATRALLAALERRIRADGRPAR